MKKADISVNQIKELFEAGLHLGHKRNRLHPKARKFIYKIESGVSIIDLTKTASQIQVAKEFLKKLAEDGKVLLVVTTKKVASQQAKQLCSDNNIPYVVTKWLPGLLTNFETLIKNVKKLKELKTEKESGAWEKLTKHEVSKLNKEIAMLEKFYGGLSNLEKRPNALFVLDTRKEKNAIVEAQKMKIPVVAVIDTNSNPDEVEYPIVANDDSPTAVSYLLTEIITIYAKFFKNITAEKEINE
ncbi:30S ribosomal protein S2 [Candidatus Roizmanbacteria bacterium]|nr:30S ribosomal protein S2 [Candidatus Roizmanbacteria bacterium]